MDAFVDFLSLKYIHQEFQVPKMQGFLNLNFSQFSWGVGCPLHKPY